MEHKEISQSTLRRLPIYLTYLRALQGGTHSYISATAIAAGLNLGEVQVRKDLATVSDSGKPKVGYAVPDLIEELEAFLGYKDIRDAVVVGCGKLGRAILDYEGFCEYGMNIVAGFDIDDSLEGTTDTGKHIYSLLKFEAVCRENNIQIGIITVPASHAQEVCDTMVRCGICAMLNFAPTHLNVPDDILVYNENIAVSLAALSNKLTGRRENAENKQ